MIPNIVKGGDLGALLRYLVGPGRANEHRDPHVISGDEFAKAWHGAELLDQQAVKELTGYIDRPRTHYGVEMRTRAWQQNAETGKREPVLDAGDQQVYRDQHVWHCSLSLPPGEVLSAEQWDSVATDYMDRMGFTGSDGKAPARWVAIHHGPSKGGNDHIHIAASMVREDGTKWSGGFRDWPRAQEVCRQLEISHGLTPVDGRQRGTAVLASKPAERAFADRAGLDRTSREQLAERIRATAVASQTEAEWLRRVQDQGVVVRPYFAKGTTDVVAGYRAALKTGGIEPLHFYGGGRIAHDLSLPRLRESWAEPTLDQAGEASAEWQAAAHGRRTGVRGREAVATTERDHRMAQADLSAFTDRLARTPITDRVAWSAAARDTAAALHASARMFPVDADHLHEAARALSRTAQERRPGTGTRRAGPSPMGTANLFLVAAKGSSTRLAAAALMTQLLQTAIAIRDYHRATNNQREAQLVQVQAVSRVQAITSRYSRLLANADKPRDKSRAAEPRSPQTAPASGRAGRGPLPSQLTNRDHIHTYNRRENDRGRER